MEPQKERGAPATPRLKSLKRALISNRLHRPIGPLSIRPFPPWQASPDVYCGLLYWFGLREVLAAMFTWLARIIDRSGATAGFGRGHIICVALVALHEDRLTGEPIE